jgi:2-phospho-L-lactate guanylyltransferase (CobY/MobA/RfbA family)
MDSVEQTLKNKAEIYMARIDRSNGNVLIFTSDLPFLFEDEFKSFFSRYSELLKCPLIGIVRQDAFRTFPFEDCE